MCECFIKPQNNDRGKSKQIFIKKRVKETSERQNNQIHRYVYIDRDAIYRRVQSTVLKDQPKTTVATVMRRRLTYILK